MSALLHPVGPRPPRVYWVRRAVAIGLAVALVAIALVLVNSVLGGATANGADGTTEGALGTDAAGGTSDGTAGDGTVAVSDATTGTEDAVASGTPEACTPDQLSLALTADARAYPAGALPVFTVSLTNVSGTSCTVDAGEASREVLITSGSDRIWSSLDCPAEPAERRLLLPAAGRDDYAVTWQRVRSAAGCTADLPAPRPGTYTAVATLAGASSTGAVFELQG